MLLFLAGLDPGADLARAPLLLLVVLHILVDDAVRLGIEDALVRLPPASSRDNDPPPFTWGGPGRVEAGPLEAEVSFLRPNVFFASPLMASLGLLFEPPWLLLARAAAAPPGWDTAVAPSAGECGVGPVPVRPSRSRSPFPGPAVAFTLLLLALADLPEALLLLSDLSLKNLNLSNIESFLSGPPAVERLLAEVGRWVDVGDRRSPSVELLWLLVVLHVDPGVGIRFELRSV